MYVAQNCRKKLFYFSLILIFLATYFLGPDVFGAVTNVRGDYVTLLQQSTPSRPASGYNRLYFKSDGFIYYLDSSGTEARVGFTNPMTTAGDTIYGGTSGLPTRLGGGTSGYYYKANGATSAPSWAAFTQPTVQVLNSGSATTYTTPAGAVRLRITIIGGGGGGSGSGSASSSSDGGNGTASTWSTSGASLIVSAGAGSGRAWSATNGGAGGSNTVNSPAIEIINIAGGRGNGGPYKEISTIAMPGGEGCVSPLGGAGAGNTGAAGQAAVANSGSGGAGGGVTAANNGTAIYGGTGGGCGGYVVFSLNAPSSTYLYTVGSAGSGGGAGTNGLAGASGGTGKIVVEEFYQ